MKHFNRKLATVVVKGGEHHIMLPSGVLLPCITSTSVYDSIDDYAEVTVTLKVNLADSFQDASEKYAKDGISINIDGSSIKAVISKSGSVNSERLK